jgi:hypothetical protein
MCVERVKCLGYHVVDGLLKKAIWLRMTEYIREKSHTFVKTVMTRLLKFAPIFTLSVVLILFLSAGLNFEFSSIDSFN